MFQRRFRGAYNQVMERAKYNQWLNTEVIIVQKGGSNQENPKSKGPQSELFFPYSDGISSLSAIIHYLNAVIMGV